MEVSYAKEILEIEAKAITNLIHLIDDSFTKAVSIVLSCKGRIVVTGMGKPWIIGLKISATLASTGTPSLSLHPAEAIHGDLGRVVREDVCLVLSNSGETHEILRLIPYIKKIGAKIIAITGNPSSPLAEHSDIVLNIGKIDEACPIGIAPTASTTAMLAMGDALAMTVSRNRNFNKEQYAFFHPGGRIGRSLMKVEEFMRKGEGNTIVPDETTVREVLIRINQTKGRPGAASIVNDQGRLVGIFTDGDFARNLERGTDFLNLPVRAVMGRNPKTIQKGQLLSEAYSILRDYKVDQLPVIDKEGRPIGLIDVQDLLDAGSGVL